MTKAVRAEYPKMPEFFRNLVPESHPLMPFYISLTKANTSDLGSSRPLLQLRSVLTNNLRFQCECGALLCRDDAFRLHKKSCGVPGAHSK